MLEMINGKRCLVLDEKVTGAFLVTYGDTDDDGKNGLRAVALVDIPFDGDDLPDPVIDTGEIEDIPARLLGSRIASSLDFLSSAAEGLTKIVGRFKD